MAIKIYGDKIVFPDNTEQKTSAENIWTDDGGTTRFLGKGNTVASQVWAENSGKSAKLIQMGDGTSYFKGSGATFFGNDSELPVNIQVDGVNKLAVGKDSIHAFQPITAPEFIGDGSKLTGLPESGVPEAPEDGETYARNNATWVSISDTSGIPDAPVDGAMYGRRDGEWDVVADAEDVYTKTETNTLLDEKADKSTTYTKAEVDASQDVQDVEIAKKANTDDTYTKTQTDTLLDNKANVGDSYTKAETYNNTEIDAKLFEKADKATTYTKEEVDDSQDAQDLNISSNTTAIGTLSGQVSQNSEDISELQNSIFFTSAYSADYPSSPNRDPEDGNMYLQNLALFTYAYADATQIFVSKTDESGNVRAFTAIQPGDSIVLNEVNSPNFGRYELVTVEDVADSYVVMNVIPKLGQGTVIAGANIAFQAFPKPDSGSDSIWTEVDDEAVYDGNIKVNGVHIGADAFASGNTFVGTDSLSLNANGNNNTSVGSNSLSQNTDGNTNSAFGHLALQANTTGNANVAIGGQALIASNGGFNTAVGVQTGTELTTGSNNTLLGSGAQASAPDASNEVVIGNDDVTKTRLKGEIDVTTSGGSKVTLYDGAITTETTRSDLSVSHHIFKDENGQIGVIRSQDGNLYFDGLVTTFAQVEGLEAKLNAKDKLIEKLSARLDELELKFKALK